MSESERSGAHAPGQLEEQFRGALRKMHYFYNTDESYIDWCRTGPLAGAFGE